MTGTKARYYLLYSGQILAGVIPHRSPPLELHDSRGYVDRAVTLTVNSLWSSRLPTSVARIPFFILHGAPLHGARALLRTTDEVLHRLDAMLLGLMADPHWQGSAGSIFSSPTDPCDSSPPWLDDYALILEMENLAPVVAD